MSSIYKKICLISFFFYLLSTFYVRFDEYKRYIITWRLTCSLPLDEYPLSIFEQKDNLSTQVGVLSSCEVAELLKTNPETFPGMYPGLKLTKKNISPAKKEHLVVRLKTFGDRCTFTLKCYFSCFPYATELDTYLTREDYYYNIIMPYPAFLEKDPQDPCDVTLKIAAFLA